ncbi:hypothetical protein [Streptomyces scopuliridis]|uniref:hypothetical protein n=1 Tax=Streptomyces scopuliridis TaxID=452529 RepID=UPI00368C1BAB
MPAGKKVVLYAPTWRERPSRRSPSTRLPRSSRRRTGFSLRRGGEVVADSCCGAGELFAALGGDEGEERAVRGTVLELSVDAGRAHEGASPGGKGVELAAAVGCAVVDFDGGRRFVDVDAADEREPVDVCPGDRFDGQGCGVQWVRHCGQPGGEVISRCAVVSLPGWCGAAGGEIGCALAPGARATVHY